MTYKTPTIRKKLDEITKNETSRNKLQAAEARRWLIQQVNDHMTELWDVLYKKALEGDIMAIKELFDRSWGKAAQTVDFTANEGNPIVFMPMELLQKHSLEESKPAPVPTKDYQLLDINKTKI